jgi:hypothetical protein
MPSPGGEIYADELADLVDRRVVRLRQAAAQALADNTATALTFGAGSEEIDTHGLHNEGTNPSRVTFDKAGFYECEGAVHFAAQASPVVSTVFVRVNGTTGLSPGGRIVPGTQAFGVSFGPCTVEAAVGDYVEVVAIQDSAGADDTNSSLYLASTLEVKYVRGPL